VILSNIFIQPDFRSYVEDRAVNDDFAGLDQFMAAGLGEVAFAHAGRSDEQDIFGPFEEGSGGWIDLQRLHEAADAVIGSFKAVFVAQVAVNALDAQALFIPLVGNEKGLFRNLCNLAEYFFHSGSGGGQKSCCMAAHRLGNAHVQLPGDPDVRGAGLLLQGGGDYHLRLSRLQITGNVVRAFFEESQSGLQGSLPQQLVGFPEFVAFEGGGWTVFLDGLLQQLDQR